MSNEYEEAFKGTRQMTEKATQKIQEYIIRYGKQADGQKNQLRYAMSIMHSVCVAAATTEGIHYDLYCDILETILGPCLLPTLAPNYWTRYLEFVRYLHYLVVNKKQLKEASRIFNYLANLPNKLQSEGDYKFILSTYGQHLMTQRSHVNNNTEEANLEMSKILRALTKLFEEMLQLNVELNFTYPELIQDFVQYIFVKRTPSVYSYLIQLPASKMEMFESFFTLLRQHKMPQPAAAAVCSSTQSHLEAFTVFLQFDIIDKFEVQLAMQHLRACSEQQLLQSDKGINYMMSLFYYMVKIVNTCSMRKYVEICGKFQGFFQKSADALVNDQWFLDALVALTIFISELHQRTSQQSVFDSFTTQFNTLESITVHLQLLLSIIKLAPNITQSKLMAIQCCSSTRKHVILSLSTSAVSAYGMFVANSKGTKESEQDIAQITELNKTFTQIVRHAINVLDTMQCIDEESVGLKTFFQRFLQLTVNTSTQTQAQLCYKLAELLISLKAKISTADWIIMLRRLYKTTKLLDNPDFSTDIQCCYVAALAMEEPKPDLALLRNQIAIYYNQSNTITTTTTQAVRDKCLLELLIRSRSRFKPELSENQKRRLYSMEMQHAIKYYKSHVPLILSLMSFSQSEYELLLLGRACKLQVEAVKQVKCIAERLGQKKSSEMNRLEKLMYAHASAILLYAQTEAKKIQNYNVCTKDCQENVLEELLLRKQFAELTIENELYFVEIALTSLKCFKAFYEDADKEFISSDVALIDWEAIVDDVATLALYLQLAGYLEHATTAWCFFYQLTTHLQDSYNQLRAVTFFCEHCRVFEQSKQLNLAAAVAQAQLTILQALPALSSLLKRIQSHVLICLCQIAYYYAHLHNYGYYQMLLDCVQHSHACLSDRQGKFDIVLSTLAAVKFRILWLHAGCIKRGLQPYFQQQQQDQYGIWRKCLLQEIETVLDQFPEIVFISSSDTTIYMILIISLLQQFAECAANRLCDHFIASHMVAVFKLSIQSGLTLRMVQLLTMWMWTNLQMESIDKAQTKLKLIEHLLGVKRLQDAVQVKDCGKIVESGKKPAMLEIPSNEVLAAMEPIRKLAQIHLSPLRPSKLQLSPSARNGDLKRFFGTGNGPLLNQTLQWTYFAVGCLNARLYFLIEDYEQLDLFYEHTEQWLQHQHQQHQHQQHQHQQQQQQQQFYYYNYENIEMLSMQHFVNYLRATGKYDKAFSYIEKALDKCKRHATTLDTVYWYNFVLQQQATQQQIKMKTQENQRHSLSKLRRVLQFNGSPDEKLVEDAASKVCPSEPKILLKAALAVEETKKTEATPKRRAKIVGSKQRSSSNSSSSSSSSGSSNSCSTDPLTPSVSNSDLLVITPDTNSDSDSFNTCQAIETIHLDDTVEDHEKTTTTAISKTKSAPSLTVPLANKRSTAKAKPQRKNCKTVAAEKSVEVVPQPATETELIAKMKNLKLATSAKAKSTTRAARGKPLTQSNSEIIILEDSPVNRKGRLVRSATARSTTQATTRTTSMDTPATAGKRVGAAATTGRSLRRAISANSEQIEPMTATYRSENCLRVPASTRRRMKS